MTSQACTFDTFKTLSSQKNLGDPIDNFGVILGRPVDEFGENLGIFAEGHDEKNIPRFGSKGNPKIGENLQHTRCNYSSITKSEAEARTRFNEGSLKRDAARLMKNQSSHAKPLSKTQNFSTGFEGASSTRIPPSSGLSWSDKFIQSERATSQIQPRNKTKNSKLDQCSATPSQFNNAISAQQEGSNRNDKKRRSANPQVTRTRVTFATEQEKPVTSSQTNTSSHLTPSGGTNGVLSKRKRFGRRVCGAWGDVYLTGAFLFLFLLFLISLSVLIYFIFQPENKIIVNVTKNSTTKLASDCVKKKDANYYSKIFSMLNPMVDPCKDFFGYACGGWMSSNYFPPGEGEYSVAAAIEEQNDRVLVELLGRDKVPELTRAEQKAMSFYQSCVDTATIEALGAQPLFDLFERLGGWLALQRWNESAWDLNSTVEECQGRLSISIFFSMNISPDPFQSNKNVLIINPSGALTLEDETFYLESTSSHYERKFKDAMRRILRLLTPRVVDDVIDDVYNFEKTLAEALMKNGGTHRQLSFERMTIRRFSLLCPRIGWLTIFREIFRTSGIGLETEVLVKGPVQFFSDLSTIIQETPTRILHHYVMWRIVFLRADHLSLAFRRAMSSFYYDFYGVDAQKPRWQECLNNVKDQFGEALELLFVRERFSEQAQDKVEGMARLIKETFYDRLNELAWLEPSDRNKLKKQLNSTRIRIGFSRQYFDQPNRLDKLYEFSVDSKKFFANFLSSVASKAQRVAQTLMGNADTFKWRSSFSIAGGYYNQERREVVLPVGYLQPPIFDLTAPEASNFGSVGSAIGHELTHAFDFFGNRNLSPGAIKTYKAKKSCVRTKYHRYTGNADVGKITLFENIADLTGLKVAYKAYQKNYYFSPQLHHSLTNEQLFFISFAQSWCTKRSREVIIAGNHAPEKYRVIGSLSDFDRFSASFSCELGTNMNPTKKCSLW